MVPLYSSKKKKVGKIPVFLHDIFLLFLAAIKSGLR